MKRKADVLIVGGGLGGLATALTLLDSGFSGRVLVLDRDTEDHLGGMARDSFGGITLINSSQQRRSGIDDSPKLALEDWLRVAEFDEEDMWPRRWAESYVDRAELDLGKWLAKRGIKFFPVVHWVERGMFQPGNSVPRFHMVWGTGQGLIVELIRRLKGHPRFAQLELGFGHSVAQLTTSNGRINGCSGTDASGAPFEVNAGVTVLASGGICGDTALVRKHWNREGGEPPKTLLNGAHKYADGRMLDEAARHGATVTHLNRQWNYAAGVHHPMRPGTDDGISLVPPKSALWMNSRGRRFGPVPLISGFDTRYLVERICRDPGGYSWQVMNYRIAVKELAVSGSEHNVSIRDRKMLGFLRDVLFGNRALVDHLIRDCPDFVTAPTVEELAAKMSKLSGDPVDAQVLRAEIQQYDARIARGEVFHDDDQLRRIAQARLYRGDRARTCRFQKILDNDALPLIAIRESILTRKTLGGIQTDLQSRALDRKGAPIDGLYAVGEAAGFGGGGIHGKGALEGTFLGSCILTGQSAARSIAQQGI